MEDVIVWVVWVAWMVQLHGWRISMRGMLLSLLLLLMKYYPEEKNVERLLLNVDISKIKQVLVLKAIFSETVRIYVLNFKFVAYSKRVLYKARGG